MHKNTRGFVIGLVLILLLACAACKTDSVETTPQSPDPTLELDQTVEDTAAAETPVDTSPTEAPPTEIPSTEILPTEILPTEILQPTAAPATAEPEPVGAQPLAADPQEINFQAEDGQELVGRYYPAATNPAPVVVLMHWAAGDLNDWNEIAFWLQNRGLSGSSPNVGRSPWLDPSWFPPLWEESSYAVFSFTFRDCDGGCRNFIANRELWLLDAVAAVETARQLQGVDPLRVAAIGASIGADGAVDGCFYPGGEDATRCESALSLSPGSYLTVDYAQVVAWGDQAGKPINCYYASGDNAAASACQSASGDLYQLFEWSGDSHGMMLLQPDIEPSAMEMILDWLGIIFES